MREAFRRILIVQAQQERGLGLAYRSIDRQLSAFLERDARMDESTNQKTNTTSLGARLIRGWGGSNHEVMVLEKGF